MQYNEWQKLVNQAREAAKAYRTGESVMTDYAYDTLLETIQQEAVANGWHEADSLLQGIGDGQDTDGDIEHLVPMLSLSKITDLSEVLQFAKKHKGLLLEPKFDGLALSAEYRDGKLFRLSTRGDGHYGDELAFKSLTIKGLPKTIPTTDPFELRGEIFISNTDFVTVNKNRVAFEYKKYQASLQKNRNLAPFDESQFLFSNARNAASGTIRKLKQDFVVPFTFACYDFVGELPAFDNSYSHNMRVLETMGVTTGVKLMRESNAKSASLTETIEKFGLLRANGVLDYPTDGIVLKIDSLMTRESLGSTAKYPRWAVAYKYKPASAETVVRAIEINVGKTGRLSFRARLEPVTISNVVYEYASLHNATWITDRDVRVGDHVILERAMEVIPYISEVLYGKRAGNNVEPRWVPPTVCPKCGGRLDKSNLLWRCVSEECAFFPRLEYAVSSNVLDIQFLSTKTLELLVDQKAVRMFLDLFSLTKQEYAGLVRGRKQDGTTIVLGSVVGDKIYDQIQKLMSVEDYKMLTAFSIRSLGLETAKAICVRYPDFYKLPFLTVEALRKVEGIAGEKADLIFEGLHNHKQDFARLASLGYRPKSSVRDTQSASKRLSINTPTGGSVSLAGATVVITGSAEGMSRPQVKKILLEQYGVKKVTDSVSASTTLVFAGEKAGSKLTKAKSLGVPVASLSSLISVLSKK